jgi:hypothetical protein
VGDGPHHPRTQAARGPSGTHAGIALASHAEKEYEQLLLTFLKAEGKPVKLATVGSKVKKPASLPIKMKAFCQERPKVFNIDAANDTIAPA